MEVLSWVIRIGGVVTFIFAIIIFVKIFKKL